jgi:hypothetical protein
MTPTPLDWFYIGLSYGLCLYVGYSFLLSVAAA